MKIIKVDNFDREHISDILVASDVPDCCANFAVFILNKELVSAHTPVFYRAVKDDHKLYKFEP